MHDVQGCRALRYSSSAPSKHQLDKKHLAGAEARSICRGLRPKHYRANLKWCEPTWPSFRAAHRGRPLPAQEAEPEIQEPRAQPPGFRVRAKEERAPE